MSATAKAGVEVHSPKSAPAVPVAATRGTAAAGIGIVPTALGANGAPVAHSGRAARMVARSWPLLRYQLTRATPAGLAGIGTLVAAAAAAGVLLAPAYRALEATRGELARASHAAPAATAKPQELSPARFAASLPTRVEIPALLGVVLAQATDAGIALDQGKYLYSPAGANHLARYSLEFPVKGEYGNIRSFINTTLAAIPALGLEKLHIERKNVGDTAVSAEVGFVIYLRGS